MWGLVCQSIQLQTMALQSWPALSLILQSTLCLGFTVFAGGAAPSSNWGDGLATQPEVLALFPTCGISNPGPVFFDPLLSKPYLSQVRTLPEFPKYYTG